MSDKTANKAKPRGKPFTGADDPRRAKAGPGRPKDENSPTYWLKKFSGMTPQEVAEYCTAYATEFRKLKGPMPMASLVAARMLLTLVSDSDSRALPVYFDRTDGKLNQPITLEPSEILKRALDELGLTEDDVRRDPLAVSLFTAAGISIAVGPEETGTTGETESGN